MRTREQTHQAEQQDKDPSKTDHTKTDHSKAEHRGKQHSQDYDARNHGRPHVVQAETDRLREHGGSGNS